MKFLFALGLTIVLAAYGQAAPKCHMEELGVCVNIATDWLHSLPKRQIPETEEDVEVMCNEINKAMDCAFNYRDACTTPLQKEVIGLLLEGTIEVEKDFCTAGSVTRSKYLTHSACLNKISQMDVVKEQFEYILAVLEKWKSVPDRECITYGCCGYRKMYNTLIKLGKENCGQVAVDTALELINTAFGQLPDVLCNGYTGEEEKCTAILPPDGAKPSDKIKELAVYDAIREILKNWLD